MRLFVITTYAHMCEFFQFAPSMQNILDYCEEKNIVPRQIEELPISAIGDLIKDGALELCKTARLAKGTACRGFEK